MMVHICGYIFAEDIKYRTLKTIAKKIPIKHTQTIMPREKIMLRCV